MPPLGLNVDVAAGVRGHLQGAVPDDLDHGARVRTVGRPIDLIEGHWLVSVFGIGRILFTDFGDGFTAWLDNLGRLRNNQVVPTRPGGCHVQRAPSCAIFVLADLRQQNHAS